MRKYILIGIGGFFGAIGRYLIKLIVIGGYRENIPLNTLFINIFGSFLLALILTLALEVWVFDPDIKLGVTTGFLGAFTTFSTFCKETVTLLRAGDYFSAISYLTVSVGLGLGAIYLGMILARELGPKLVKKKEPPVNLVGMESEVE